MVFSTKGNYVSVRLAYRYVFGAQYFVRLKFRAFITCTVSTAEVMCRRIK
jgi:hypothetical protein